MYYSSTLWSREVKMGELQIYSWMKILQRDIDEKY